MGMGDKNPASFLFWRGERFISLEYLLAALEPAF
jgi:hypothetical protein